MRTTKKDIVGKLQLLNKWLPVEKQITVEWSYGRPRLHDTWNRDIGPRLPMREMIIQLDAMIDILIHKEQQA